MTIIEEGDKVKVKEHPLIRPEYYDEVVEVIRKSDDGGFIVEAEDGTEGHLSSDQYKLVGKPCPCGSEKMYHEKKSEWFCPFCYES